MKQHSYLIQKLSLKKIMQHFFCKFDHRSS
jgi:hypothetical protein